MDLNCYRFIVLDIINSLTVTGERNKSCISQYYQEY